MKTIRIFIWLVATSFFANAQTLQTVTGNGSSTNNTLISTNPNGFQVTGTPGSPAYFVVDQTANPGGKRWRFGHTGISSGFGGFDILNLTDGIAPLSITANGNVGIGTLSPENGWKLDVNGLGTIGTSGSARLYLGTIDSTTAIIQSRDLSINQKLKFFASSYDFDIGNVGIGNTNPTTKLSVSHADGYGQIATFSSKVGDEQLGIGTESTGYSWIGTTTHHNFQLYANNSPKVTILANGSVGIGTANLDGTYKLSVKGKIRAQEIKVEASPWPDYVFTKSYQLPSLQETEKHIKEKGHLPGIPSAVEVKANGIDLGEMNAKLLQKIEELTLHLIEIKKEHDDEKSSNKKLYDLVRQQNEKIRLLIEKVDNIK